MYGRANEASNPRLAAAARMFSPTTVLPYEAVPLDGLDLQLGQETVR